MKHLLNIAFFKTGTGFTATCSCGRRISRPTGCNRAGMVYALSYAWQMYKDHCIACGAKPVMHKACEGLAGWSFK